MSPFTVSIVIPVFNEEKRLSRLVSEIFNFKSEDFILDEIIFVNDGSTDDTLSVLDNILLPINKKILTLSKNCGKGKAVKEGVLAAEGDYVLIIDADGSTPLAHLNDCRLISRINTNCVIIGSRYLKGSSLQNQPFIRKIVSLVGKIVIKKLFKFSLSDTQCGFKFFPKDVAHSVFPLLTINRWAFDIELITILRKKNIPIIEIPVIWNHTYNSQFKIIRGLFNTLSEVILIKNNLIRGKYN